MIERRHSQELHPTFGDPVGYHHVTIVQPGRLVFLAGQMPVDDSGRNVVGVGDLDAQVDRLIVNVERALAVAEARPEDVVRSVLYVVGTDPEFLGQAWLRLSASRIGPAFTTAATLLGVAGLGIPGQLVELELTAALVPLPVHRDRASRDEAL
jgi:enamine deaminase RidA (YjgF/YER057c/UK114 family)